MTGGAGQLIANMNKTCRCISNVYEECGSYRAFCMTWGRARNHFYLFIFLQKELIRFLSSHASP